MEWGRGEEERKKCKTSAGRYKHPSQAQVSIIEGSFVYGNTLSTLCKQTCTNSQVEVELFLFTSPLFSTGNIGLFILTPGASWK